MKSISKIIFLEKKNKWLADYLLILNIAREANKYFMSKFVI